MTTTRVSAANWVAAGNTMTADALELRFGAVLNGLFDRVVDEGGAWFLVDNAGRVVDCASDAHGAEALLGTHVTRIAGLEAAAVVNEAWLQVHNGRAHVVWPWHGGRAQATMRSVELHPIRDVLGDDALVVGALVVFVDAPGDGA
jgi:hypothetical protein